MSDTYLSTGSMAWPGEPETDFNIKKPIWEELDLPYGPQHSTEEDLQRYLQDVLNITRPESFKASALFHNPLSTASATVSADEAAKTKKVAKTEVDWDNFDFANAEKDLAIASSPDNDFENGDTQSSTDLENFFSTFDDDSSASKAENSDASDFSDGDASSPGDIVEAVKEREIFSQSTQTEITKRSNLVMPSPWITPTDWIDNPEYNQYVNYSVWSKYPTTDFEEADNVWWDEDIYIAQCVQHVLNVTDLYLTDHTALSAANDERRAAERYLDRVLSECKTPDFQQQPVQYPVSEEVPVYMTPDKNRGVKYSDEVIEMKGKLTLLPYQDPPSVKYAADRFTHNEELEMMNKIGTIRDQYNWQPDRNLVHEIEPEKLSRIEPLINYINHAGELQSTKDNILIFDYRGTLRHIIGIRASMMELAKTCFPELEVGCLHLVYRFYFN